MIRKLFEYDGLLSKIMRFIADVFILNLLIILGSLPIITFGVAITSAFKIWIVYNQQQGLNIKDIFILFFKSYKENIKEMTVITVIYLFVFVILVGDIIYFNYFNTDYKITIPLFIILLGVSLLSFLCTSSISAQYNSNIKKLLLNGILLVFMNIKYLPVTLMPLIVIYLILKNGNENAISLLLFILIFFGWGMITFYLSKLFLKFFQVNENYSLKN